MDQDKKSVNGIHDRRSNHEPFRKLFEDGLKDIYWVEKELLEKIPVMMENARSTELRSALEEHLDVTGAQV